MMGTLPCNTCYAAGDFNICKDCKIKVKNNKSKDIVKEPCICEYEGLYKGQNHKLFILNEVDYGGSIFHNINPNYCPVCGKELPDFKTEKKPTDEACSKWDCEYYG